jgi:hypothetical protein
MPYSGSFAITSINGDAITEAGVYNELPIDSICQVR